MSFVSPVSVYFTVSGAVDVIFVNGPATAAPRSISNAVSLPELSDQVSSMSFSEKGRVASADGATGITIGFCVCTCTTADVVRLPSLNSAETRYQ